MDVSLDDLIQKDRQKTKNNFKGKKQNPGFKTKKIARRQQSGNPQRGPNFRPNKFANRNAPQKFQRARVDQPRFQNRIDNRQPQRRQFQPEKIKPQKEQAPPQEKGRTLKVLGLHPDITNEDLYKLFAAEGALEKCMIEQDNFGRNLPQALVKYHSADMAKQAIANLNTKKVMNSVLTVEPYRRNP